MRRGLHNGTDRRIVWAAAAVMLAYPDERVLDRLDEVAAAVRPLPPVVRGPLEQMLDHLRSGDPVQLAEDYVRVLDQKRSCAPYLTYYAHGDTRRRGMALVDVVETYRAAGFRPVGDELPDHLAVALEFAATVDPVAGQELLVRHRPGLDLLAGGLARAGSPYAALVQAVLATLPPPTADQRQVAATVASGGPPAELVGLTGRPGEPGWEGPEGMGRTAVPDPQEVPR